MANRLAGIIVICGLMGAPAVSGEPGSADTDLSATIQYLLDFVKNSECTFFRNNKAHNAAEAAAHIQRKYDHFKDKIKTPEDFIRLTATKSLMTGKLYYVKLKDGRKIASGDWLQRALEDYRQKPK